MAKRITRNLEVFGARIGFRNFSGDESLYNPKGNRTFAVFFDEGTAKRLEDDGWNIKWPKPNDNIDPEEDERQPWLEVTVSYKNMPPTVLLITGENVNTLNEDTISVLDNTEIENVDLVINPYNWTTAQGSGVKAYLKKLAVSAKMDGFAEKYGY